MLVDQSAKCLNRFDQLVEQGFFLWPIELQQHYQVTNDIVLSDVIQWAYLVPIWPYIDASKFLLQKKKNAECYSWLRKHEAFIKTLIKHGSEPV